MRIPWIWKFQHLLKNIDTPAAVCNSSTISQKFCCSQIWNRSASTMSGFFGTINLTSGTLHCAENPSDTGYPIVSANEPWLKNQQPCCYERKSKKQNFIIDQFLRKNPRSHIKILSLRKSPWWLFLHLTKSCPIRITHSACTANKSFGGGKFLVWNLGGLHLLKNHRFPSSGGTAAGSKGI